MTIYDASPTIIAVVISIIGYLSAKISRDRAIAARDARRAAERAAVDS